MIETINPTYKVSSLKYGFKVETQDKEKAEKIDENLSKTIRFIEALSKYHTFSSETSCMDGAERTSYYPHYVIDEDGKLTGIDIKYSVVKDNSYYGRRPSYDRGTYESYSMDKIKQLIDCILPDIKDTVKYLRDMKKSSPNYIANKVLRGWNISDKIKELENDIIVLSNI